jgi:hypothetical protein
MRWHTFTVTPIVHGPIVAENIRLVANDPLTRDTLPLDAEIFRRRLDNGERFFFSPSAVRVFEPFISMYGGVECEPPFQAGAVIDDHLRLDLGCSAMWEPARASAPRANAFR